MKSKKYVATYKLERDVDNLKIPNVTISQETGIVELSPSGIKIAADGLNELRSLQFAARIATVYASEWRGLTLKQESILEDGQLPRQSGIIVVEAHKLGTEIDVETFRNTMCTLLAIDSDSLLFLIRAFELQGNMNELAILNAMFGLDLQLSRLVPQPQFRNWSGKTALLDFLKLLPSDSIKRLKTLGRLRDVLAHGDWTNPSVGDRLNDLLEGGRDRWLISRTRVSSEATRLVIEQILRAFDDLTRSRKPLEALIKQINKASLNPTQIDNEKEGR